VWCSQEQEGSPIMCMSAIDKLDDKSSNRSEVARLRQQIALELDAMRSGLFGISTGTARHTFIHARMERIGACQDTLAHEIGETAASQVVCSMYMQTMEQEAVC
jgi:hypothetical protein